MTNPTSPTELIGTFLASTWRAEDGTALIAKVRDQGGHQQTIKGPTDAGPPLTAGVQYRFHGQWQIHERFGEQFSVACWSAVIPHDRKGVIAYLMSLADNVGEKRAERLWDAYGPFAVETLRQSPEAVAEKGIMSLQDAQEASQTLHDEAAFESVKIDLLTLFAGRGFQASKLIKECISLWRHRAPELIRRNPYLLMLRKLPSAGWKRCDKLYLDLGLPPARLKRQTLCAVHFLKSSNTGDTWFPASKVGTAIEQAVPSGSDPIGALRLGIRSGKLARKKDPAKEDPKEAVWIAEASKAASELACAFHVRRLISWKRSKPVVSKPSSPGTSTGGATPA